MFKCIQENVKLCFQLEWSFCELPKFTIGRGMCHPRILLFLSLCLFLGIQAVHFDRDDIDLPGFKKFFKESSEEELKHARLVI